MHEGVCKRPDDMSSDTCLVHVQDDVMLDACSGKEACNVSVARMSLRACAHNASFLFVEYQCIQGQCQLLLFRIKCGLFKTVPAIWMSQNLKKKCHFWRSHANFKRL